MYAVFQNPGVILIRSNIKIVLSAVIFLAGLAVFLYPSVTQRVSEHSNQNMIRHYEENVASIQSSSGEEESQSSRKLAQLREEMENYNQEIYENGQRNLNDPFSYEEASFHLEEWNLENDMFGYLVIPKMDLELPVYLGASKENMSRGAAHLSWTSLPVGGENTNAVLAAHRGFSKQAMFREIEKLEIGDEVIIRNPWDTLRYKVSEIRIIEPDEVNQILIQKGKDLVTLLTCHPYTRNDYRYVVYCERIEEEEVTVIDHKEEQRDKNTKEAEPEAVLQEKKPISYIETEKIIRAAGWALIIALAVVFFMKCKNRRRR